MKKFFFHLSHLSPFPPVVRSHVHLQPTLQRYARHLGQSTTDPHDRTARHTLHMGRSSPPTVRVDILFVCYTPFSFLFFIALAHSFIQHWHEY